ncbi:MAG: transcriptional regulator [Methanomassiliicoccales archaeon]
MQKEEIAGRRRLLDEVEEILSKSGFYQAECSAIRSITFDVIARRDRELLFIKVLRNVDGFGRETAEEMKSVSAALHGRPLIIGSHSGGGKLEDGIVYSRFNVPIMTVETLREELLEGVPPFIKAEPGGFYVHIDGEMLKRMREDMSLSLGSLAEIAGVSRKAIQMYENGMKAMVDVAQRLEEFFNMPFVLPFNYWDESETAIKWNEGLEEAEGFEAEIFDKLDNQGWSLLPTYRSAFSAITKHLNDVLIAWCDDSPEEFIRQAQVLRSIMSIAEKDALVFLGADTEKEVMSGIPVINRKTLMKIRGPEELIAYAQERAGRR